MGVSGYYPVIIRYHDRKLTSLLLILEKKYLKNSLPRNCNMISIYIYNEVARLHLD
jgi:hypothetical protein